MTVRTKLLAVLALPLVACAASAIAFLALGDGGSGLAVGIACGLMCAAGIVAFMLLRSVLQRVDAIGDAADELRTTRLPELIEATDSSDPSSVPTFEPFAGESDDPLGRAIGAFNAVPAAAGMLRGKQDERIRQGLSELVVNLVRRNQSLLDRQIEHIDRLEASEEDPDRLEELFDVDHLSTRMRRNAESLLVLAGSEPPRRRGEPISMNDLMRVALSEIEGYQVVQLSRIDDGQVSAQAAFDIAHLLSELLENATQFSPPESTVEMAGAAQDDGGYLISIADRGIGMNDEQIGATNELLANPPELNLSLSRSLGFIVVGRLAKRVGVRVELAHTPGGAGVTALILIPQDVLMAAGGASAPMSAAPTLAPVEQAPAAGTATAPPLDVRPVGPDDATTPLGPLPERPSTPAPAPAPTSEPDPAPVTEPAAAPAVAESDVLSQLLGTAPTPTRLPDPAPIPAPIPAPSAEPRPAPAPEPTPTPPPAPAPATAETAAEVSPVEAPTKLDEALPTGATFDRGVASLLPDGTPTTSAPPPQRGLSESGLVKRDRSQSQAPASEGRVIPNDGAAATASSRDPDEIRSMLSRYRENRSTKDSTNPTEQDPSRGPSSGGQP